MNGMKFVSQLIKFKLKIIFIFDLSTVINRIKYLTINIKALGNLIYLVLFLRMSTAVISDNMVSEI